jgi:hypothetical protein
MPTEILHPLVALARSLKRALVRKPDEPDGISVRQPAAEVDARSVLELYSGTVHLCLAKSR